MSEKRSYRAILIDPDARTIAEITLEPLGTSAIPVIAIMIGAEPDRMLTPVSNVMTGDSLYVRYAAGDTGATPWQFLGDTYHGKAVIAGRKAFKDAVVPMDRVKTQVKFGR
jgi:hypothetical protein